MAFQSDRDHFDDIEELDGKLDKLRQIIDLQKGFRSQDRSRVPGIHGDHVTVGSIGKIMDARERQYDGLARQFGEKVRSFRNVPADALVHKWLVATRKHDHEDVRRIERELHDKYGSQQERALLSEGATTAVSGLSQGVSGPLVPLPLAASITLHRDQAAKVRRLAQVLTTSALTLRVPHLGVATAAYHAEGSGAAEGAPTTGSVLMSKKKIGVKMSASDETVEDTSFNLVSVFSERAGSAIGAEEDRQFCDSAASDMTTYLSEGSTAVDTGAGATTFADLNTVYFSLGQRYRARGIWACNDTALAAISSIVDANNRPLFIPYGSAPMPIDDAIGAEGRLFNRPIVSLPLSSSTRLVFGDFRYYGVLDGGGIRVKVDARPASDETDWYFSERVDGAMLENATVGIEAIIAGTNIA